jgi:hypothetical protein
MLKEKVPKADEDRGFGVRYYSDFKPLTHFVVK